MKRIIALSLALIMAISVVPCISFAASSQTVIDALGGTVLWSAPDGEFYDTAVSDAFDGWSSYISTGYVNVRTYSVGTTIQYYVNGTDSSTVIITPSYGTDRDKVIIEWVMKRTDAEELHFDFYFYDISSNIIAPLAFNNEYTSVSESYPMGYPASGTDCAIVAYNNEDGVTHTAEYYVAGEMVYKNEALANTINGFWGISSSNAEGNTSWAHIGFANLTIGAADKGEVVSVTATYKADGEVVSTKTLGYVEGGEGATFEKQNFYYNGDVWYSPETTLKESGDINLIKYERYKTKNIGDVFELDGTEYKVTGDSAIVNGNFITGDTMGWTNRLGTEITDYTIVNDYDYGNMLSLKTGGKDATNSIGTAWSVTPGQKYLLSFTVVGNKPESRNYTYNQVFQSDKSTSVLNFGERMNNANPSSFNEIVEPTGDSLYFQCSWTDTISFACFQLLPVEEYVEEPTEEITEEVTEEPTEEVTEEVTEEPTEKQNRYDVIEDAFVQYNTLYGINTTNTYGLMIGSSADGNRGPEYDANGETTYLTGATPTTLGSTRVGLVKFPVIDIEDNERATLKVYARDWHQQGFDGGNTFLRIAVTPLADSSWAELSEGSSFTIASEPLLESWATPVFSEKCAKETGYFETDVTEIMHAAKNADMEYISLKMQIYWGATYCVEREAAVEGGSYEGKGAYIELSEDEDIRKLTTSGDATLTKNGSAMNGFCYVTDNDDVRLQLSGATVIGADSGYYFPNEKIVFSEDTDVTNTISLGFGLTMVNGAQVRYGSGLDSEGNVGSDNGLRFITTVNRSDTLAGVDNAELGVIISAEDSENTIEIKAEKWQNDTTFTTALTKLAVSNYNRNFTATPYVKAGGKTFTGDSVTRSIYQVAAGLLVKGSTDNTEYDEMNKVLYDVLNAYVNQVGIRLTFTDNADFTDWEIRVRDDGKGSYMGDAFFEVGETEVDGKVYSVTLTPLGENTIIKDNWNKYIRINNNNSQVKLYTTLTDNNDGTYTLAFDISNLIMGTYPEEKFNQMKPTYERAVAAMENVNTYWQENTSYIDWYGSTHPAFWDKAAYHTGNIEMYKLTGDESYLQYSIDWANYNEWMGNNSTADPSEWTWGYNQTQGSNAVLFGDWQICFQTYIDLYDMGVEGATLDRVYEVIDYQISKDDDDFWWWADALYMVMPVMTKLYKQTGDEKYLDALYKYFKYAKELMYDGPGGIPTDADGYTTSAALNSGASYSDPDDYKYLFYRDAGYVYPLSPNTGHEDEKNFWARGNGWVFAGLGKVLSDMPTDYEHYDEFYQTYVEMAEAIVSCQQVDEAGYGFWTQSMLQDYPKGSNSNDEGYETSGTAFFTYGLFWGINNKILTEAKYTNAAIRAWGYLENVALHEDGKVGYVQPIGSNATQAVSYDTTANFGVGAYLLAAAEAARWAEEQN